MARKRKTPEKTPEELENEPLKIAEKKRVDMAADLDAVRRSLMAHGFGRTATDAAGEIWLHRTVPWRWTLLADPNGVLRAELRDPAGNIVTEVRPATAVDVEAAMPL